MLFLAILAMLLNAAGIFLAFVHGMYFVLPIFAIGLALALSALAFIKQ